MLEREAAWRDERDRRRTRRIVAAYLVDADSRGRERGGVFPTRALKEEVVRSSAIAPPRTLEEARGGGGSIWPAIWLMAWPFG